MVKYIISIAATILLVLSSAALAHWDVGDSAKWVQMPDVTPMGIDVNASDGFILADDYLCTETGKVTEVHIWGSWLNDYLPYGDDPTAVGFILSFHVDIPDSESPTGYSIPGNVVMYGYRGPDKFTVQLWDQGTYEGWLDPPGGYSFPSDQMIWQYNFPFEGMYFGQEGTPENPKVYWLDVQAFPFDENAHFGWKTSATHWNDDAVWGTGEEPYVDPWNELRYPLGHEMYGQSIDLAFVIVSEPSLTDWGDAPDPTYPTTAMSNGASHLIGGPWLGGAGDKPDGDADGQPDPAALGDDNDGNDDENGVQIPVLTVGVTSGVTFEVRDPSGASPFVEAWIDFDRNGVWDGWESVVSGAYPPGVHTVPVTPPAGSFIGQTFSRWRISSVAGLSFDGAAPDGEVEDYEVTIREDISKWLQEPDLTETGIDVNATDPFILADDFLCTETGRITEIFIWGSWMDDYYPFNEDPGAVTFRLSFHDDVPDSMSGTGYSMPGDLLWEQEFSPGTFDFLLWAGALEEGWMNPPDEYWFPGDYECWLYYFGLPAELAFLQSGTEAHPRVYWLDVQAFPEDPNAVFGWKTSLQQWNDDAVWAIRVEPYPWPWRDLRYPPIHPMAGRSIDLAFRLITEPASGAPADERPQEGLGMLQNTPNPFTGSTTIRYMLPGPGRVRLEVFDVAGRMVHVLVDEAQSAGLHSAVWDGRDSGDNTLPSGVYFYRLSAGEEQRTMKMLLLR